MNFIKRFFTTPPQTILSYQDFWKWFRFHEKRFYNQFLRNKAIDESLHDELSKNLQALDAGFTFLIDMHDDNTLEFIISADCDIKKIVYIEEFIALAPVMRRWRFTALKPAITSDDFSLEVDGLVFSGDTIHFYPNYHEDFPDEIDITFVHKDLSLENRLQIENGMFLFLENFLGELKFVDIIDNIHIESPSQYSFSPEDLVPIKKLHAFLHWRQKEFVEDYEEIIITNQEDEFAVLEAALPNGGYVIANVSKVLLNWTGKANYPWVVSISVYYNGNESQGFPTDAELEDFQYLANLVMQVVVNTGCALYIGRETGDNIFEIYLATNDFRTVTKKLDRLKNNSPIDCNFEYLIYKDKYWKSFERFKKS